MSEQELNIETQRRELQQKEKQMKQNTSFSFFAVKSQMTSKVE